MIIGKSYKHIWPDGGSCVFKVINMDERFVHILFINGSFNKFCVGSPMHVNSFQVCAK